MVHSAFWANRFPRIGEASGRLGCLSLPHLRGFHCLVQYLTGLTIELLMLGARCLLNKPANVLPLAEGFCLLSKKLDQDGSEPAMELQVAGPGIF